MGNRDETLSSAVLAPDLLDGGPETEPLNDVTSFPSFSAQISELQVPAAAGKGGRRATTSPLGRIPHLAMPTNLLITKNLRFCPCYSQIDFHTTYLFGYTPVCQCAQRPLQWMLIMPRYERAAMSRMRYLRNAISYGRIPTRQLRYRKAISPFFEFSLRLPGFLCCILVLPRFCRESSAQPLGRISRRLLCLVKLLKGAISAVDTFFRSSINPAVACSACVRRSISFLRQSDLAMQVLLLLLLQQASWYEC